MLAFSLVLFGCPQPDNNGSEDASAEELAEQLAADINGIKAGAATANGTTVTIINEILLGKGNRTSLTVPEGVTLDLTTGDHARIMLNDATLTVNGTVITNTSRLHFEEDGREWDWEGSSILLEDGATWATINGSGTIRLEGKGNLLLIEGTKNVANRKLTLDGVTLVGIDDNDSSLVEVRGNIGNGYTGEFIMKSGKITGNTLIDGEGSGIGVRDGGIFIMEGGTITDNTTRDEGYARGGGVALDGVGSTFTMKGGTISGNTAISIDQNGAGAGVFVRNKTTFTMEGGIISGNTSISAEGNNGGGGDGVRVQGDGVFTLKGGTIYGKADKLPSGTDISLANRGEALDVDNQNEGTATVTWGTGGTYTKGGIEQIDGSNIVPHEQGQNYGTDETLIATPAQ